MSEGIIKKFYASKEWRQLRDILIVERKMTCQKCGKHFIDTSQLIGHHIIELNEDNVYNADISLNKDNIEVICYDCHNKEHRRFGYNQHNVYVVYGAPLSGTKKYVREVSRPGDLIVDIDKLYEAVSGQPLYVKPDNLRFNVFRIYDTLIDNIKTRYGKWCDAYIIGGYALKSDRERLQQLLNAELIYCEATKEECYSKVSELNLNDNWYKYIDKWFDSYIG